MDHANRPEAGAARYHFRGRRRETGEAVEGRVCALSPEAAAAILSDNGIVADALDRAPAASAGPPAPRAGHAAAPAAGDEAGIRVVFDPVTCRYQATCARSPESDEARQRLARLAEDLRGGGSERIAEALEGILRRSRNAGPSAPGLEAEVSRLAGDVKRIERAIASMSTSPRRAPGTSRPNVAESGRRRDEVLVEVFESNLELMRGLKDSA